jgi:hypothetical protein
LVYDAQKATTTIHECVDKIRRIMDNTKLNLCCGGLQEVGEAECLEVALAEDEIAYHGSVGLSMSIPDQSTSVLDLFTSISGPSMS